MSPREKTLVTENPFGGESTTERRSQNHVFEVKELGHGVKPKMWGVRIGALDNGKV